jgi:hypothetical protein
MKSRYARAALNSRSGSGRVKSPRTMSSHSSASCPASTCQLAPRALTVHQARDCSFDSSRADKVAATFQVRRKTSSWRANRRYCAPASIGSYPAT